MATLNETFDETLAKSAFHAVTIHSNLHSEKQKKAKEKATRNQLKFEAKKVSK